MLSELSLQPLFVCKGVDIGGAAVYVLRNVRWDWVVQPSSVAEINQNNIALLIQHDVAGMEVSQRHLRCVHPRNRGCHLGSVLLEVFEIQSMQLLHAVCIDPSRVGKWFGIVLRYGKRTIGHVLQHLELPTQTVSC